jgi:hypothetical protein
MFFDRQKYNFSLYAIYVPPSDFYSNDFERIMIREVFTYETLMINQIIYTFEFVFYLAFLNSFLILAKWTNSYKMWIVMRPGVFSDPTTKTFNGPKSPSRHFSCVFSELSR